MNRPRTKDRMENDGLIPYRCRRLSVEHPRSDSRRDGRSWRLDSQTRWAVAPARCRVLTSYLLLTTCLLTHHHASRADDLSEPVQTERAVVANSISLDTASGLLATASGTKFLGTRSCAATACHGGVDPDPRFTLSRRNEFPFWLDHDPHARAQFTLSNAKSQRILARLERPGESSDAAVGRLANCLACHNPQPAQAQQATTYYPHDGVSCEHCHGAAEKWIGAHVEADWQQKKSGDTDAWQSYTKSLGYIDNEDLTVRGTTCAQCHVGSPGREVNHDLIAAGHPVLKFELAAYHELLPKHWRDTEDRQRVPRFEAQLWSAGQVTAAHAALSLLAWRAAPTAEKHPDAAWPELAEFDCFACHHDLEDPSWRRQRTIAGLPLGMPAWATWSFGPLRLLADSTDPVAPRIADLTRQMQHGFGSDREKIQTAASAADAALQRWRQASGLLAVESQMRRALHDLAAEVGQPASADGTQPTNWDEAVQIYLAIVALDRPAGAIDAVEFNVARELFSFPEDYDSPRGFLGNGVPGTLPNLQPPLTYSRSRQQIVATLVELIGQLEPVEN